MIVEYPPEAVDTHFDSLPESGDTFVYNGEECLIERVNIVNEVKLEMKISRKRKKLNAVCWSFRGQTLLRV